jgi:uncharacterized protein (TIGR02996 family)
MLSLLRAAKEAPEDDLRRLVLADWLEEHGDNGDQAKAALLRSLVAGGAAPPAWVLGTWHPLLTKMKLRLSCTTEGFLEVRLPARKLASWPVGELAASEEWAWVAGLTVVHCNAAGVARLIEMALHAEAVSLSFPGGAFGEMGAAALAQAPPGCLLRRLDLSGCQIEASGCRRLLRAAFLPQLEALDLTENRLSPTCIQGLAEAPFGSLRELFLDFNHLREGPGYLARARWLPGLRSLSLSSGGVTVAALQQLLRADVSGLRWLHLSCNDLPPTLGPALAGAEALGRLTALKLHNTGLGDSGLAAIARSPLLPRLKELGLCNCAVTADGLRSFDDAPRALSLESLELAGGDGDRIAALIARSPWAAGLKSLSLGYSRLGDAGVAALAGSEFLTNLAELDITSNAASVASIARLRERFGKGVVVGE